MADPDYRAQKAEKFAILAGRAAKVRRLLAEPRFAEAWKLYPFNSGLLLHRASGTGWTPSSTG